MPAKSMLKELEARVRLPPGEGPITLYSRYYIGEVRNGSQKILGVYHRGGRNFHMHVLELNEEIPVSAGTGCDVIEVVFDVRTRTIEKTACGGEDHRP